MKCAGCYSSQRRYESVFLGGRNSRLRNDEETPRIARECYRAAFPEAPPRGWEVPAGDAHGTGEYRFIGFEHRSPDLAAQPNRFVAAMDDFRGAWELDYDGQAALTFLIDWYNSLLPTARPAGHAKQTLILIARRMPESRDELAAIKGVPRRWAQQYGEWLTGRLIRATSEANPSSYKLLEPAPYTTFGETIIRGWLEYARAMVSEQVSIAPEIAFPTWLMNRLLRACFQANTPEKLLGQIAGWRADWLAEPLQQMWHASWGGQQQSFPGA